MTKRVLLGALFVLVFGYIHANDVRIDTIYYDRDWRSVSHKAFATYYRVCEVDGSKVSKAFRDYYITGELQAEGNYISIDKNDDANSLFDGKCTSYYKSGRIEQTSFLVKGVAEGDYTVYYENGLVKLYSPMKNGKMNGILYQFSEDGNTCTQVEMVDGEPKYDYYVVSNKDGLLSKFSISDKTQIWESPEITEMKTYYFDGKQCSYYLKNGILLSMTNSQVKDYGKWFQVSLLVANNTMMPFDIDPLKIKAELIDIETLEKKRLAVYSSDRFIKKVKNSHNWKQFFMGLSEGLAAANAGYSASVTQSNTIYNGNSSVNGNVSTQGGQGRTSASYNGHGSLFGSTSTTSSTVAYNGAATYQAQVIASNRIADNQRAFLEERAIKEEGYLKRTTVYPGETISGYFNIMQEKGCLLNVIVDINGAKYNFGWLLTNNVGPLKSANSIIPKKLGIDKMPQLPCLAEIMDIANTKMNVVVLSIDSDMIFFKAVSANGRPQEPLMSFKTEKLKSLVFK